MILCNLCIKTPRKAVAHNLCVKHYRRLLRHGDPHIVKPGGMKYNFVCKICGGPRYYSANSAMCEAHWKAFVKDYKRKLAIRKKNAAGT